MAETKYVWRRISRGALLMGLGTFMLLTTLDVLPWTFWVRLLPYWPIVLVMVGVRMMFERSRAPWGILLSPVLLLALMTYVAVSEGRVSFGPGSAVRALRPPEAERWELEGTLARARLDLHARPLPDDVLVEGEVAGRGGRPRLTVGGNDESPRVQVRNLRRDSVVVLWPSKDGMIEADVASDLPIAADLELTMVEGVLDLAQAPVSRVDLVGALQDITLRLGVPEEEVHISLKGAFNRLILEVPASTQVRTSTGGFMNFTRGRKDLEGRSGPGYRVRVRGTGNRLVVRSH